MLAKADAANASHEAIIAAAVHCYDKGEHEAAVRYAKKAIEKYGSPDGWAIYGIVSEYGHKPYRKDIVQAGKYYMSAAKCDTVPTVPKLRAFICEYLFKVIIQDEKEYSFDPEPAKYIPYLSRFINICCDDGNIDAKRSKGVILYQGGEYDEAYSCLTEAFNETADIYAAKYLGALHFSVDSYKDMDKAAYYYRILVDKEFGTPLELGLYCRMILSRFPEGKDNTEDYQWYLRKGAEYGNNFCKFSLGVYYAIGSNGFWKNTTKARELLMDLRDDPEFGENARKALTLL
jgi:tetratricopeptide (TPR) repeat protein